MFIITFANNNWFFQTVLKFLRFKNLADHIKVWMKNLILWSGKLMLLIPIADMNITRVIIPILNVVFIFNVLSIY